MHAPPPCSITLRRFDGWKMGCGLLVMTSLGVVLPWSWTAVSAYPLWCAVAVVTWALASLVLAVHGWRLSPQKLRWDGQIWRLSSETPAETEGVAGSLSAALDLGAWMLLRFTPHDKRRALWIPAQRRGHEAAWHGLRAAIYSARPVALPPIAPF